MSEYTISQVCPTDRIVLAQIDALLQQEGIRRDGNLDYICAMFDEEYNDGKVCWLFRLPSPSVC